jgi:hypothetical protein
MIDVGLRNRPSGIRLRARSAPRSLDEQRGYPPNGPGWSGAPSDPVATWCPEGKAGFTATVRTGTDIGSGAANTKAIIKACGSASAAGVAAAYRGGGKTDWYLPSKDEVNTLFRKRAAVGGIPAKSLWSSSQSSHVATYAWGQLLVSEGRYIGSYKGYDGMVRPLRAF